MHRLPGHYGPVTAFSSPGKGKANPSDPKSLLFSTDTNFFSVQQTLTTRLHVQTGVTPSSSCTHPRPPGSRCCRPILQVRTLRPEEGKGRGQDHTWSHGFPSCFWADSRPGSSRHPWCGLWDRSSPYGLGLRGPLSLFRRAGPICGAMAAFPHSSGSGTPRSAFIPLVRCLPSRGSASHPRDTPGLAPRGQARGSPVR